MKINGWTKADRILIAGVTAVSALTAVLFLAAGRRQDLSAVVVEQDGKEILRLPAGKEERVRIPWEDGFNVVVVTENGVLISEADCPDQICVRQGEISGSGESIVCLPHRLVVRLAGTQNGGPDAMTN